MQNLITAMNHHLMKCCFSSGELQLLYDEHHQVARQQMLTVQNITKTYGKTQALQGISFSLDAGEIVAFLGPNGAGKSTAMKIMSGCAGADTGEVYIAGKSMQNEPIFCKQQIGYLPEHPPLYPDMDIFSFLTFVSKIKRKSISTSAIEKTLELVGLHHEEHRVIGNLSKGYQQRVGLAQALIHDPPLLLLDEPFTGLDPEQRIAFRQILMDLVRQNRTVLLSTHILSDVADLCDRLIIISEGKIIGEERFKTLRSIAERISITVQNNVDDFIKNIEVLPQITNIFPCENGRVEVELTSDIRTVLATKAIPYGLVELKKATKIEEVYLRIIHGSRT